MQTKLQRAEEHFRELGRLLQEFFQREGARFALRTEQRGPLSVIVVAGTAPVPRQLALVFGDMVHNLRTALDHLAWQLVLVNGKKPSELTKFPIADTELKYKSIRMQATAGMSKAAVGAIDNLRPFGESGDQILWRLHRLDIVDKHRLVLAVGAAFSSVDIGTNWVKQTNAELTELWGKPIEFPPMPLYVRPADRMFPLKVGDVLFECESDYLPPDHEHFHFQVAIGEPGVVEGEDLFLTAHALGFRVRAVLEAFRPALGE